MKKVLLTLMAVAILSAPVAFAAEEVATPGTKKLGVSSTGEEVGNKIKEYKDLAEDKKAEAKEQILERVKERARFAVQNAVRKYTQVREKINALNISAEDKSEIIDKIDAQVSSMNALEIQIQAATTVDEVKNVMRKTQTQFKYSLGLVKQSIKGVYEDRLEKVLENSVAVYEKIEGRIDEVEEGTSKTDLEAQLSQANSLLSSAGAKITSGDLDGAKADLILAKQTMSEIVTTLNGLSE